VSKVDAAPFDPTSLGSSLVLWLDAADAKTGDAGDLVVAWPDHLGKYTTSTKVGGATINCTIPGIHVAKEGKINHSAVTFCGAILGVSDAASLQMANAPFFISAVFTPGPSNGTNDILFTKTLPGDSNTIPSFLTLLAPSASNRFEGSLNGNGSADSPSSLSQEFQYDTFERNTSEITSRVNASPGTSATVNSSDDVSNVGAAIGIGGYEFDIGNLHGVFRGELAEIIVVLDPSHLGPVELYLKKKYNL
jgi:hypothetical protein